MGSESESPAKRVELSDGKWVELRKARLVADVRHQRERRHERGDYDDDVLDELSLIEARVVAWSYGEKVPADMGLRRIIIDALEEDDALKLIMANKGITPKDLPANSQGSSTGTSRRRKKAKMTAPSPDGEESGLTNG